MFKKIIFLAFLLSVTLCLSHNHLLNAHDQGPTKIETDINENTSTCSTSAQRLTQFTCGDTGCWSWCKDDDTLAANFVEARGKWCITNFGIPEKCGKASDC